jgi:hypothetical protein
LLSEVAPPVKQACITSPKLLIINRVAGATYFYAIEPTCGSFPPTGKPFEHLMLMYPFGVTGFYPCAINKVNASPFRTKATV